MEQACVHNKFKDINEEIQMMGSHFSSSSWEQSKMWTLPSGPVSRLLLPVLPMTPVK